MHVTQLAPEPDALIGQAMYHVTYCELPSGFEVIGDRECVVACLVDAVLVEVPRSIWIGREGGKSGRD